MHIFPVLVVQQTFSYLYKVTTSNTVYTGFESAPGFLHSFMNKLFTMPSICSSHHYELGPSLAVQYQPTNQRTEQTGFQYSAILRWDRIFPSRKIFVLVNTEGY